MNRATHRDLTGEVADAVLPDCFDDEYIDELSDAASLPDETDDIVAGRFGKKAAGHPVVGLDHFCIPTDSLGHMRGYNWHLDASLCHAIRRFDPRVGDVRCDPAKWIPVVGLALALEHPLARLIRSLTGRATLDSDNVTFPTGAVMAEWVWKVVDLGLADKHLPPPPKVVGCVCHFIQDACIPQHARGWLLKGHASIESAVERRWSSDDKLRERLIGLCHDVGNVPMQPRSIVELAATSSFNAGREGGEPDAILRRGVEFTANFLRATVAPLVNR